MKEHWANSPHGGVEAGSDQKAQHSLGANALDVGAIDWQNPVPREEIWMQLPGPPYHHLSSMLPALTRPEVRYKLHPEE